MKKQKRKRKCLHCREFFAPDSRNANRQKYCSNKPECRKASKAASQRRWLQKPENQDYFRSPENVCRVQQWRKKHPGYARRRLPGKQETLQDPLAGKDMENQVVEPSLEQPALQEVLSAQDAVLIGLIAHLTDNALQDHIASTLRRLQELGRDIVYGSTQLKGGTHDQQKAHLHGTHSKDPQAVQLGGSPAGA